MKTLITLITILFIAGAGAIQAQDRLHVGPSHGYTYYTESKATELFIGAQVGFSRAGIVNHHIEGRYHIDQRYWSIPVSFEPNLIGGLDLQLGFTAYISDDTFGGFHSGLIYQSGYIRMGAAYQWTPDREKGQYDGLSVSISFRFN